MRTASLFDEPRVAPRPSPVSPAVAEPEPERDAAYWDRFNRAMLDVVMPPSRGETMCCIADCPSLPITMSTPATRLGAGWAHLDCFHRRYETVVKPYCHKRAQEGT